MEFFYWHYSHPVNNKRCHFPVEKKNLMANFKAFWACQTTRHSGKFELIAIINSKGVVFLEPFNALNGTWNTTQRIFSKNRSWESWLLRMNCFIQKFTNSFKIDNSRSVFFSLEILTVSFPLLQVVFQWMNIPCFFSTSIKDAMEHHY